MDSDECIEHARKNIWQAIKDYRAHTSKTEVLDNITDNFVNRLAKDNFHAKQELRELFRTSRSWDENLQAIVINGTRTHNPDYIRFYQLAHKILNPIQSTLDREKSFQIDMAINFFVRPSSENEEYLKAIKALVPRYDSRKKKSRIFKSLCDSLGVTDNSAGSDFQKYFAQIADELNSRKIDFKLYISISPANFLTMSNPEFDKRGSMLTSCHSLNSRETPYNCGCSGYARDNYSFIVFTAADPNNPETLNNRKTTRQIFAYKPGNGLLLQSRLFNKKR